jgi:hypothetical protein
MKAVSPCWTDTEILDISVSLFLVRWEKSLMLLSFLASLYFHLKNGDTQERRTWNLSVMLKCVRGEGCHKASLAHIGHREPTGTSEPWGCQGLPGTQPFTNPPATSTTHFAKASKLPCDCFETPQIPLQSPGGF